MCSGWIGLWDQMPGLRHAPDVCCRPSYKRLLLSFTTREWWIHSFYLLPLTFSCPSFATVPEKIPEASTSVCKTDVRDLWLSCQQGFDAMGSCSRSVVILTWHQGTHRQPVSSISEMGSTDLNDDMEKERVLLENLVLAYLCVKGNGAQQQELADPSQEKALQVVLLWNSSLSCGVIAAALQHFWDAEAITVLKLRWLLPWFGIYLVGYALHVVFLQKVSLKEAWHQKKKKNHKPQQFLWIWCIKRNSRLKFLLSVKLL